MKNVYGLQIQKKKYLLLKYRTKEIKLFFKKAKDGLHYGICGNSNHLTHLNINGKITLHKTTNLAKGEVERKQLVKSIDSKIAVNELEKDLQKRLLSTEYTGEDLFKMNKETLTKLLETIINPKNIIENKKSITIIIDIEQLLLEWEIILEKEPEFIKPINKQEISKNLDEILINTNLQMMVVFDSRLHKLNDPYKVIFTGKFGNFFGYEALGILQIATNLEEYFKEILIEDVKKPRLEWIDCEHCGEDAVPVAEGTKKEEIEEIKCHCCGKMNSKEYIKEKIN